MTRAPDCVSSCFVEPGELRFGVWTLRRSPRELLREGKRVSLQELPLQLLEELLLAPGRIVTREHLVARLWPKRVVDYDTALNTAVRRLRAALDDDADAPRYVETIPRIGYRFLGTVDSSTAAPPTEPARKRSRWLLPAAASLVALVAAAATAWWSLRTVESPQTAALKSIAVLPFLDLSPNRDQQYFSDGLAEEILNVLAQAPELRVTARTSSFAFRNTNVDIASVAEKLRVAFVVEGSVRHAGERLRVTAQLIDARTSAHLWSEAYERDADDVFTVQREIAAAIATALQIKLGTLPPPPTPDPVAYDRFLQAQFFVQRRAPGDVALAQRYYQEALAIDDSFARAWAGLAGVYWLQSVTGELPRDVGLGKLYEAAQKALALDADVAEAHMRMANYYWSAGDRAKGNEHSRRAAASEPNHPLVLLFGASAAALDGRLDDAIRIHQRAAEQDPLSPLIRENLGSLLLYGGRLEQAAIELQRVHEMRPDDAPTELCIAMVLSRRFDAALHLAGAQPAQPRLQQCRAMAYHALGRVKDADAALATLIETARHGEPLRIAETYAYRGDPDAAFEWLTLTAADLDLDTSRWPPTSQRTAWELRYSPILAPLHADPRWTPLLAQARIEGRRE